MKRVKNKQTTRLTVLIHYVVISMCFINLSNCRQVEKQSQDNVEKQPDKQVEQVSDKQGDNTIEKKLNNPTDPSDKESLERSKSLYAKYCESCHGITGKVIGENAGGVDFTSKEFQSQSDEELFNKINIICHFNFKEDIKDAEDMWLLINHLRTLHH